MPRKKKDGAVDRPIAPSVLLKLKKQARIDEKLAAKAEKTVKKSVERNVKKTEKETPKVFVAPRATVNQDRRRNRATEDVAPVNTGVAPPFSFLRNLESVVAFLNTLYDNQYYSLQLVYMLPEDRITHPSRNFVILQRKYVKKHQVLTVIKQWECANDVYKYVDPNYDYQRVKVVIVPFSIDVMKLYERNLSYYQSLLKGVMVDEELPLYNAEEINLHFPTIIHDNQQYGFIEIETKLYDEMNVPLPEWIAEYEKQAVCKIGNWCVFKSATAHEIRQDYMRNDYKQITGINVKFMNHQSNSFNTIVLE